MPFKRSRHVHWNSPLPFGLVYWGLTPEGKQVTNFICQMAITYLQVLQGTQQGGNTWLAYFPRMQMIYRSYARRLCRLLVTESLTDGALLLRWCLAAARHSAVSGGAMCWTPLSRQVLQTVFRGAGRGEEEGEGTLVTLHAPCGHSSFCDTACAISHLCKAPLLPCSG